MLSIIVPVYNSAKYLNACINSILGQSYSDFELILVDDCSSDASGSICEAFAKKDKRIKVLHNDSNFGVVYSRKAGVRLAEGEYVGFVDSDDYLLKDCFGTLMWACESNNADVAVCGYKVLHRTGITLSYWPKYQDGFYDRERLERELFPSMLYKKETKSFGLLQTAWGKVIRRRLLLDSGFLDIDENIRVGEDVALCSCFYPRMRSLVIVPHNLYVYRITAGSMTRRSDSNYFARVDVLMDFLKSETDAGFENERCSELLSGQLDRYCVLIFVQGIRLMCESGDGKSVSQNTALIKKAVKKCKSFRKAIPNVSPLDFKRDTALWVYLMGHGNYRLCALVSAMLKKRYVRLLDKR